MTSLFLLRSMIYSNNTQKSKKKRKVLRTSSMLDLNKCRICYEETGQVPIFDNMVQANIAQEIKNFSGIMINNSDTLPKSMCQSCLDLLNGCIMFKSLFQKTNRKLLELVVKKEEYNESDSIKTTKLNSRLTKKTSENVKEENNDELVDYEDETYHPPSPYADAKDGDILECSYCSSNFSDFESFKSHVLGCEQKDSSKSEKDKKKKIIYLCDICGKICPSNAGLIVHKTTHENKFPYKCEQCPYQGRTMDLLRVHKRSHMTDKPFKCSQCPKSTTTASNLAKHMRHVHSTNRPFKCSYCDRGFPYQHDLNRHVRDIHLRQGTVECDICFKKFNTKKILQGHRSKIHKIKGEKGGRLPSYLLCQDQDNVPEDNMQYD